MRKRKNGEETVTPVDMLALGRICQDNTNTR